MLVKDSIELSKLIILLLTVLIYKIYLNMHFIRKQWFIVNQWRAHRVGLLGGF